MSFKKISISMMGALLLMLPSLVFAYMLLPIDGIYDGDTIYTHVAEYRLPAPLNKLSIRVKGIDTPELGWRAKCDKEAQLAEQAKQALIDLIGTSTTMKIDNFQWDKYGGRVDSDVIINGVNVAQYLVDKNLAVVYDGGTKTKNWCD